MSELPSKFHSVDGENDYIDISPLKPSLSLAMEIADTLHGHEGLNSFAFMMEDGHVKRWANEPCYGRLYDYPGFGKKQPIKYFIDWPLGELQQTVLDELDDKKLSDLFYDRYNVNNVTVKEMKQYIHYCISKSPFAHAFASKKVNDILQHGSVIKNNVCMRTAITACTSIRYIHEFSNRICNWVKLRKHMSDDLAFILMHYMSCVSTADGTWQLQDYEQGHTIIAGLDTQGRTNFLGHTPRDTGEPLRTHPYKYSPLRELWSKNPPYSIWRMPFKTTRKQIGTDWGTREKVIIMPDDFEKGIEKLAEEYPNVHKK